MLEKGWLKEARNALMPQKYEGYSYTSTFLAVY
jgi:hypothetical protein